MNLVLENTVSTPQTINVVYAYSFEDGVFDLEEQSYADVDGVIDTP